HLVPKLRLGTHRLRSSASRPLCVCARNAIQVCGEAELRNQCVPKRSLGTRVSADPRTSTAQVAVAPRCGRRYSPALFGRTTDRRDVLMLTKDLLNPILTDEALTRGLGDAEARMLVEWLVEEADRTTANERQVRSLCR